MIKMINLERIESTNKPQSKSLSSVRIIICGIWLQTMVIRSIFSSQLIYLIKGKNNKK